MSDDEAGRSKVLELIDSIDYALLTTHAQDDAGLHARPMAYRSVEADGDLWFFTKSDSRKAGEIRADPRVVVNFADPQHQHFVVIAGRAAIVADRAVVKERWSELYRAWFPGGPDDPNVVALRISAEKAEFWDTPTSAVVYAFGYAKALISGKPSRAGEVGTVDLT